MNRLSELYGRLLSGLALLACAVLFLMMLMICADVLLRNVALVPGLRGLPWSNELTEYALYLLTMLTAPWLLHRGQHIRVDIVLRVVPRRIAWYCEWLTDLCALACCVALAVYGWKAVASSHAIGSMIVKTLAVPEWWLLAPLPAAFAFLAVEIVFRMHRLHAGERGPRTDAVTVS